MAEQPGADGENQPASYSPPPKHRPAWLDPSRVSPPSPGALGPGPRQAADVPGRPPAGGTSRTGTILAVALLAALVASMATWVMLLASGQLDRQLVITEPVSGQPASAARMAPDILRVVEENAVTTAVEAVSPAVVTITPRQRDGSFVFESVGSGVIYDADGWVVTNRHVVCNADSLTVQLADGQRYEGRIHGLDTLTDLAIVKIEGSGLPAVGMGNSATLQVGQHAIAIGSPLGTFTNSVTAGVVSALGRQIDVQDSCTRIRRVESLRNLIQTDAAINPGNSGGALVDTGGELIGINTAIAGEAEGIGFAIPINLARPIMEQAIEGEELSRPWMGIYYTALTPVLQDQRGLLLGYGALVESPDITAAAVLPGSPADQAGLRAGDIITHVDTVKVDGENTLDEILTQYDPRESLTLRVLRGEALIDLRLTLGIRPSDD
ncbi:MAG: trypsin-like peptidase domain-containing protein [Chloroflexota bacterium]|jgi:S1-C subfamily serine protease